jgi:TATA-binding protein-associated factor
LAPLWSPLHPATSYDHSPIDFPPFSVEQLIESDNLLLSSSGQEFSKPTTFGTPAELERARKEAKSRLGLDFLDAGDDDDDNGWTQELMEEATDVRMSETNHEQIVSPDSRMDAASPGTDELGSPMSTDAPIHFARPAPPSRFQSQQGTSIDDSSHGAKADDDSALSAREKNRLKRKRRHQAGSGAYISPAAAAPPSK